MFLPAKNKIMKKIILLCLLLCYAKTGISGTLEEFFKQADQLLQTYVNNGKVDYRRMKNEPTGIRELYKDIGKIDLKGRSRDEIKAFYLNAYNIIVIHETLYSKKRRKLFRTCKFFKEVRHKVSGQDLTLEKLERKYLVLKFRDPNIYLFLGHSTLGKSQYQEFAIFPKKMNQQLEYMQN